MIKMDSNFKRVAAKVAKLEKDLVSESRKEARKAISKRVSNLRAELEFLVNQYQRVPGTNKNITSQPLAQRIAEEQALGKSRAIVPGDDFHTSMDSNTYKAALVNGGNNYAMRVRNDSIMPDDSYESYRDSFRSTLTDKVFAIQDESSGSYRYYIIPPGSPLMDEVEESVKIFCSSYTDTAGMGRDDGDPLKDIGVTAGRKKFSRDREKGFTEFTLKEDAIKAIRDKGTDITDVVLNTQHGEYEDAHHYSRVRDQNSPAMKRVQERTQAAMEGKSISTEQEALSKTNKAIKNIAVKESSNKQEATYTIETSIDGEKFVGNEVLHAIKRELVIWSKTTVSFVTEGVGKAITKVLDIFNKGR